MVKLKGRRVIVHVGNVGRCIEQGLVPCEETLEKVKRFQSFDFHGIDIKKFQPRTSFSNWTQHQCECLEGLDRFKDNSVDLIVSRMTIGIVNQIGEFDESRDYSKRGFRKSFIKLKPGGKLLISIPLKVEAFPTTPFTEIISSELVEGGFSEEDITIRPFREGEYNQTFTHREFKTRGIPLLYVTAKKRR